MPEMNGRELSNKLLAICPTSKCLFMSGYTADIIARHGALADDVHFIQKPFQVNHLADKLREVLDAA
jgi:FixJ family two-component response regulator